MCDDSSAKATGSGNLWIAGVVIVIIGSVTSNGGINLQKLSIMRELGQARNAQRPYVLQPMWILGLLGVIIGAIADFGSLAFAAQSLLIPLGGLTLLANIYFARLCLGERMSRRDFIATLFITGGIICIAVTGSKEETCYTLAQLVALYSEPGFIAYALAVSAVAVALYVFTRAASGVRLKYGPWSPQYARIRKLHVLALPCLSGVSGAQTVWTAKSVAEMVKTTIRGDNQLMAFGFYALLIVMTCTIIGQLHFMAMALKISPALVAVPVFQSIFITVSVIGGGVYFKELSHMSNSSIGVFMFGLVALLFGIWLLSLRPLEGDEPPSRAYVAGLAARFIIRVRRATRLRQALQWPNKLASYSCDCTCHSNATVCSAPQHPLLARPGGAVAVLPPIMDVIEDTEFPPGDTRASSPDTVPASGGHAARPSQTRLDIIVQSALSDVIGAVTGAPAVAAYAPLTSPENGPSPGFSDSAPVHIANPLPRPRSKEGAGAAPEDGTRCGRSTTPAQHSAAGALAEHQQDAEHQFPTVDADGAPLPHMCARCFCRETPLSVLAARDELGPAKLAVDALTHSLPHAGTASLDSGSGNAAVLARARSESGGVAGAAARRAEWDAALATVLADDAAAAAAPATTEPVVPTSVPPPGRADERETSTAAFARRRSRFGSAARVDTLETGAPSDLAVAAEVLMPARWSFYDASAPAVPSYLRRGDSAEHGAPPRSTTRNVTGGSSLLSSSVGGIPILSALAHDDGEDVFTAMGEGLARLRASTATNLMLGLSAINSALHLGSSTAAPPAGAPSSASATSTVGTMSAGTAPTSPSGFGGDLEVGNADHTAGVAGSSSWQATDAGQPRAAAGNTFLKPVAHALAATVQLPALGFQELAGAATGTPRFARMAESDEGWDPRETTRSADDLGRRPRAPPPPPPSHAAPPLPPQRPQLQGGTAGYLSADDRMLSPAHRRRVTAPSLPAGDRPGVEAMLAHGGDSDGAASRAARRTSGISLATAGMIAAMPAHSRRAAARRRRTRHGGLNADRFPMPGSVIVGAGLEGLGMVTVAALKRLITPSVVAAAPEAEATSPVKPAPATAVPASPAPASHASPVMAGATPQHNVSPPASGLSVRVPGSPPQVERQSVSTPTSASKKVGDMTAASSPAAP